MTEKAPQCIGIVLDGNRRWARERGLPTLEGHRRGAERLREAVQWVRARGISHMVVYAFSTENWNRTPEEVGYLMKLFGGYFDKLIERTLGSEKEKSNIRFIGDIARAPVEVQDAIKKAELRNVEHPSFTLWVCFSYGGRSEIIAAAEMLRREGKEINEESVHGAMWSAGMPDPDIIIRPGGEKRLSNFLTWQSIYSELFFIQPYWPDFSEAILDVILKEYADRERRRGK